MTTAGDLLRSYGPASIMSTFSTLKAAMNTFSTVKAAMNTILIVTAAMNTFCTVKATKHYEHLSAVQVQVQGISNLYSKASVKKILCGYCLPFLLALLLCLFQ